MFERGKIVLVPFPFTDLSAHKVRPALIVSNPKHLDKHVIVTFITSQSNAPEKTSVVVSKRMRTFSKTGLKMGSTIRCDKLASLEKTIVLGEIGEAPTTIMSRVSRCLKVVLHLT